MISRSFNNQLVFIEAQDNDSQPVIKLAALHEVWLLAHDMQGEDLQNPHPSNSMFGIQGKNDFKRLPRLAPVPL